MTLALPISAAETEFVPIAVPTHHWDCFQKQNSLKVSRCQSLHSRQSIPQMFSIPHERVYCLLFEHALFSFP